MKRLPALLCSAALAFAPAVALAAPPSIDATAVTAGFGSTSNSVSFSTAGPNRLVVVPVCLENAFGGALAVLSVTVNGVAATKRASNASAQGGSAVQDFEIWTAPAASTLSSATVTVTSTSGVDDAVFGVFAVAGLNSTAAPSDSNGSVPATAANSTADTGPTVAPIATSQANDLLLAGSCAGNGDGGGETVTGWTNLWNDVRGPGAHVLFAHLSLSYTTVTATQSSLSVPFSLSPFTTINVRYVDALTADASGGGGFTGSRRTLTGAGK